MTVGTDCSDETVMWMLVDCSIDFCGGIMWIDLLSFSRSTNPPVSFSGRLHTFDSPLFF